MIEPTQPDFEAGRDEQRLGARVYAISTTEFAGNTDGTCGHCARSR
ncbi:hypothetical protein ABZ897_57965 [Nonomuraea sp. NPDC046802]